MSILTNRRLFGIALITCLCMVCTVVPQFTVYADSTVGEVSYKLYDGKGVEIKGFKEGVDGITITMSGTGAEAGSEVVLCYGFYTDVGMLVQAGVKNIPVDNNGVFELTVQNGINISEVPENANRLKLFSLESLKTIKPIGEYKEILPKSDSAQAVMFDSKEMLYSIELAANETACMSIDSLAAVTEGTVSDNTVSWADGSKITFEEGSRLAEDNSGRFMLQCEPFYSGEQMYVPVSVLEPIKCWSVYYDRINRRMEIKTGTDYPTDEPREFKVIDYGAKGDGITDDGPAITNAIYDAMASGVPAKVVLESERTYLVGERADCMSYFTIYGTSNLTVDGQGSTILLEHCTNTFLEIKDSSNVKFKNIDFDYKELPFTQGKIVAINPMGSREDPNEWFEIQIDEGYPLPPANKWVNYLYRNSGSGGWAFGKLMEPDMDMMKFVKYNFFMLDLIYPSEGERTYRVTLDNMSQYWTQFMEVGDRFVINTRFSAYDISDITHTGATAAISVYNCADITFDHVNLYASPWLGVAVGYNQGRINFLNFGEKTKPGRLLCVNSDGIHCYRNKEGITVKNSTFMSSLDDQINTKGEDAVILTKESNTSYIVDYDLNYRVGDKLIFFDKGSHNILGTAYLKEFEMLGTAARIVVDREIQDAKVNHIIYNVDSSTSGTVISDNLFQDSRRHAYITRSENSMFENNQVVNCGGSVVSASNEILASASEGPFPSSFTMRNNEASSPGTTHGFYPIEVMSWWAENGSTKAVDGFLIENNRINVPVTNFDKQSFWLDKNVLAAVRVNSVNDLYMFNNKITSTAENDTENYHIMPVYINNSVVRQIDGLDCMFKSPSENNAIITLDQCEFDAANLKNINDLSGRNENAYSPVRGSSSD